MIKNIKCVFVSATKWVYINLQISRHIFFQTSIINKVRMSQSPKMWTDRVAGDERLLPLASYRSLIAPRTEIRGEVAVWKQAIRSADTDYLHDNYISL